MIVPEDMSRLTKLCRLPSLLWKMQREPHFKGWTFVVGRILLLSFNNSLHKWECSHFRALADSGGKKGDHLLSPLLSASRTDLHWRTLKDRIHLLLTSFSSDVTGSMIVRRDCKLHLWGLRDGSCIVPWVASICLFYLDANAGRHWAQFSCRAVPLLRGRITVLSLRLLRCVHSTTLEHVHN